MRSATDITFRALIFVACAGHAMAVATKPTIPSHDTSATVTNIESRNAAEALGEPAAVAEIMWEEDLDNAFLRAAAESKPVLLYATMPGCAPCRKLELTTFSDMAVRKRLQTFICVKFDITEQENLAAKLRVEGTPTLMVMSSRGEEQGRSTGYLPPADFLSVLEQIAAGKPASDAAKKSHDAIQAISDGNIAADKWPDILISLGDEHSKAQITSRILALKPLPRRDLVAQLANPQLAVRLGALQILEQVSGDDFSFDPWQSPPAKGEIAPPSLLRWQKWVAGTNDIGEAMFVTLTRDQAQAKLTDLLSDDRDRSQRARNQLIAAGPAAAELAASYLQTHTNLPPGLNDRVREVRYAALLKERPGFDPAMQAQRLVFGNLDVQLLALRDLKPQGKIAMPVVEDYLVHPNPVVREAAVESLLSLAGRDALPRLKKMLAKESNREVIITTARGLGSLRVRSGIELLTGMLDNDDEDIVIAALTSIAKLGSGKPSAAIIKKLSDARWRVRAAALQAANTLSLSDAYDAVQKLLSDEDQFVRYSAIMALPKVNAGDEANKRLIKAFLADDNLKPPVAAAFAEQNKPLPSLCVNAMTNSPPEVVLGVFDAYEKESGNARIMALKFANHKNDDIACAALHILAEHTAKAEGAPALLAALKNGNRARVLAVLENLSLTRDPESESYASSSDESFDNLLQDIDSGGEAPGAAKATGALGDLFSAFLGTDTVTKTTILATAQPQSKIVTVNDLFKAFDATQAVPTAATETAQEEKPAELPADTKTLLAAARDCMKRFPNDNAVTHAADMVVLQSGDTNAVANAAAKIEKMNDDQRAWAAYYLGKTPTPEALAQIRRLLRDPSEHVRQSAAAALAGQFAVADWGDVFFNELIASNSAIKISTLSDYSVGQQVRKVSARDNLRRWAGRLVTHDDAPRLQALAAVIFEECNRKDDATNLTALAKSNDRYVRRSALHALAKLDAADRQHWIEQAAADVSDSVREVVPAALAQQRMEWYHRISEKEAMSSWNYNYSSSTRSLKSWESDLLTNLAQDPTPAIRVQSCLALMSGGAPFDPQNLMDSIVATSDASSLSREAANFLETSYRKLNRNYAVLLPLLDEGRITDDTRDAIARKLAGPAVPETEQSAAFREVAADATVATQFVSSTTNVLPITMPTNVLRVVFFHENGCETCATVREILKTLKDSFPEMKLEAHEMGETGAYKLNAVLCEKFNVPDKQRGRTPTVFAGAGYLVGNEINFEKLADLFARSGDVSLP